MPTLSFDVLWRDHGASRGLRGLSGDADKAHTSFGKFSSMADKGLIGAARAAARFATVGVAALVGAGAAATAYGLKVASSNEQARISFTTMLGSAAKADKFLRELQRFAATTPFEFPELQKAASSLISVGVNAEDVLPIMRTLGDVTSGMGTGAEGVDRATRALQQMQAAGRITAEDLNQLRDAGIPLSAIFDAIGQKTGKSAEEIAKMSRTGKLGRVELNALMDALESGRGFEKFNGLMEQQSQSLAGMWSTLKDTFGQGLAQAITPAIPIIKRAMDSASAQLNRLSKWVDANQATITSGMFDIADGFLIGAEAAVDFAASAVRGFGHLQIAAAQGIESVVGFVEAMAKIPGTGALWQIAAHNMRRGTEQTARSLREGGEDALRFGTKMDTASKKVDGTRASLLRLRNQQVLKAEAHDTTVRFGREMDQVGNKIKLTERELRTFNVTSNTGTARQRAFRAQLNDARDALVAQYRAADRAGAKSGELNRITSTARERFRAAALAMGFSKREADKLADSLSDVRGRASRVPRTVSVKIKYDTWVDEQNARLVQRAGRFAVQMSAGGSRADLARSPATMRFLSSGSNLPNGFGGPAGSLFTATERSGRRAVQDRATDAVQRALGPAADRWAQSSGPYGQVTDGGAGRAAGIREGMRWASGGGTYPGHHPSMSKAWDFMISSTAAGNQIAGHLWANRARLRLWYLIWNRRIISMTRPGSGWLPYFDGMSSNPNRAHTNHVHASWYANGTRSARQGLAVVGEHGPELVNFRGGERVSAVSTARPSGGSSVTYIINAPHYVGDKNDLKKALVDLDRQGALQVIKR
jgi:tape measure domain-containing protein